MHPTYAASSDHRRSEGTPSCPIPLQAGVGGVAGFVGGYLAKYSQARQHVHVHCASAACCMCCMCMCMLHVHVRVAGCMLHVACACCICMCMCMCMLHVHVHVCMCMCMCSALHTCSALTLRTHARTAPHRPQLDAATDLPQDVVLNACLLGGAAAGG